MLSFVLLLLLLLLMFVLLLSSLLLLLFLASPSPSQNACKPQIHGHFAFPSVSTLKTSDFTFSARAAGRRDTGGREKGRRRDEVRAKNSKRMRGRTEVWRK